MRQSSLFADQPALPDGFAYRPDLLTIEEEARLAFEIGRLPFKPFEFRQYRGLRRVVSFGWRYDFALERMREADPPPSFLLPVRARAAAFADLEPGDLAQVLLTEYAPGAGIGWHRDKAVFAQVVGVSLVSPCRFRFRRRQGRGWERAAFTVEPRSAYLLDGPARYDWEHSIPAGDALRYSLTFRRLVGSPPTTGPESVAAINA